MPMKKDLNFGFKFNLTPPQNDHLAPFENHLYDMVCNIEFNTGRNDFQKALISDLKKIQSSKNVLVFSDKTTNLYEMSPSRYNSLLTNKITKLITNTRINKETTKLSKPLKLDNKMECYAERCVFITLKDHKENCADY